MGGMGKKRERREGRGLPRAKQKTRKKGHGALLSLYQNRIRDQNSRITTEGREQGEGGRARKTWGEGETARREWCVRQRAGYSFPSLSLLLLLSRQARAGSGDSNRVKRLRYAQANRTPMACRVPLILLKQGVPYQVIPETTSFSCALCRSRCVPVARSKAVWCLNPLKGLTIYKLRCKRLSLFFGLLIKT